MCARFQRNTDRAIPGEKKGIRAVYSEFHEGLYKLLLEIRRFKENTSLGPPRKTKRKSGPPPPIYSRPGTKPLGGGMAPFRWAVVRWRTPKSYKHVPKRSMYACMGWFQGCSHISQAWSLSNDPQSSLIRKVPDDGLRSQDNFFPKEAHAFDQMGHGARNGQVLQRVAFTKGVIFDVSLNS